jgi:phospholipid-binding lipoprotein MlaA
VLFVVLALALGGCAGLSGGILRDAPTAGTPESPPALATERTGPDLTVVALHLDADETRILFAAPVDGDSAYSLDAPQLAMAAEAETSLEAQRRGGPPPDVQIEEYDPWEPFNEAMFEFNRWLDRWVLKPVAKGYNYVIPDLFQQMIGNGFDNIRVTPRFINCLLQAKWGGAGREVGRLLINSTLGIAGMFDIAKQEFGIQKCNEDTGQTLGVWGFGPGPYLILPFLPPLTVRDAIGYVADGAMDPLAYFLPFIWERLSMKVEDTVNDRSVNLDLYQGFEETTVEFYSALRNAYLQRRLKLIKE